MSELVCSGCNLQSVDDSRDVTEYCQQDVDEEVCIAASLKEDTKRWEDDGKDNLADVAGRPVLVAVASEACGRTYDAVKGMVSDVLWC